MNPPLIVRTVAELRTALGARGADTGFVPTMGYLHDGHAALMHTARPHHATLVVSIFVNPLQFNDPRDLAAYPRDLPRDTALCAAAGVDVLWLPDTHVLYPPGFDTVVRAAPALTGGLCGATRPGHFDGVATVVAALFNAVRPRAAYFGEKDWQQLAVVRRMAADLQFNVDIVGCPTVREADGLAMSSRNARLSPEARARAAAIPRLTAACAAALAAGTPVGAATAALYRDLEPVADRIDYVEVRDAATLVPVGSGAPPGPAGARLFVAAFFDGVRLIDNIPVTLSEGA